MMNRYIGIDVGKEQVDICWLKDPQSGKKKTKKFKNKPDAFAEIQRWLVEQTQVDSTHIVVLLEATGVYPEALSDFLSDQGFKLIVANPGKAKKFAQSIGLIHKTDKSDAAMLAQYGYSQPYSLALWEPEAQAIRELKAMMRRLSALEKDCRREKNRLEASEISDSSERVFMSLRDMVTVLEDEIKALKQAIDDHISQHPALR